LSSSPRNNVEIVSCILVFAGTRQTPKLVFCNTPNPLRLRGKRLARGGIHTLHRHDGHPVKRMTLHHSLFVGTWYSAGLVRQARRNPMAVVALRRLYLAQLVVVVSQAEEGRPLRWILILLKVRLLVRVREQAYRVPWSVSQWYMGEY